MPVPYSPFYTYFNERNIIATVSPFYSGTAVSQYYEVDVNKEPVIKGNSVVMKCGIPSFVADFVTVLSWRTDRGDSYYPGMVYGIS